MAIRVYLTSRDTDDRLARKADLQFAPDSAGEESRLINVHPEAAFQTIEGFGGAFTEAAAVTFSKLVPEVRERIISAYFDPNVGHGYSLCRTHINSCDFSLGNYSYVDENDYSLKSFSIEHENKQLLPMIRQANAARQATIKILASPWSPPGWMKTTGTMNDGGSLKEDCRPVWAAYYARYVKACAEVGVPIWAVSIQNEAKAKQKWDSCVYTAEDERDFVRLYLGPTLEREGLSDVKVFVWDHNKERVYERAMTILGDPGAARYVDGLAIHWYSGDHFEAVLLVRNRFPQAMLIHTEACLEFRHKNVTRGDWTAGERYGHDIIGDLCAGASGWIDWNMLLDETGGPNHLNNFCISPIMADTRTSVLSFEPPYWYMGHFSRFIKPGARQIGFSRYTQDLEVSAARNLDGEVALVVMNRGDVERQFTVRCCNQIASTAIPAHSIATLCWKC